MKFIVLWCLLICTSVSALAQAQKAKSADFDQLTGQPFTGTLTYYDYVNNTQEKIQVILTVTPSKTQKNTWSFNYQYPDEPEQNETENIILISGGSYINDQKVVERSTEQKGTVRITTEDTNAHTQNSRFLVQRYLLSEDSFTLKVAEKLYGSENYRPVRTFELKR